MAIHDRSILNNRKGFTLVEMIVAMAVFIVVLVIAAQTFDTIITQASRFSKSEESNIEGIIGLEVLRHDLEQMGFGLPWGFCRPAPGTTDGSCANTDITYQEAADATGATINDAPGAVPRAIAALNSPAGYFSDFIAIKGTTVGRSKASQRWTYIPFKNFSVPNVGTESRPVSWPSNNLKQSERVTLIRSNFNDPADDHLLIGDPSDNSVFFINFNANGGINDDYLPKTDQQTHLVYGIDDAGSPRMPFNRADFFVSSTSGTVPPFCAPLTGVLYKMTVNQSNGQYTPIPLLDCVADMQVVLGWDTSDEGKANSVDAYSSLPASGSGDVTAIGPSGAAASIKAWMSDAKSLREHLKMIKIYILAQNGKRENGFTYPQTKIVVGNDLLGEKSLTNEYVFSADQLKFHWKLYRIIARPKNLVSNQR